MACPKAAAWGVPRQRRRTLLIATVLAVLLLMGGATLLLPRRLHSASRLPAETATTTPVTADVAAAAAQDPLLVGCALCAEEGTRHCTHSTGGLCECRAGWTGHQCADDIDECAAMQTAGPDALSRWCPAAFGTCVNARGSWSCLCHSFNRPGGDPQPAIVPDVDRLFAERICTAAAAHGEAARAMVAGEAPRVVLTAANSAYAAVARNWVWQTAVRQRSGGRFVLTATDAEAAQTFRRWSFLSSTTAAETDRLNNTGTGVDSAVQQWVDVAQSVYAPSVTTVAAAGTLPSTGSSVAPFRSSAFRAMGAAKWTLMAWTMALGLSPLWLDVDAVPTVPIDHLFDAFLSAAAPPPPSLPSPASAMLRRKFRYAAGCDMYAATDSIERAVWESKGHFPSATPPTAQAAARLFGAKSKAAKGGHSAPAPGLYLNSVNTGVMWMRPTAAARRIAADIIGLIAIATDEAVRRGGSAAATAAALAASEVADDQFVLNTRLQELCERSPPCRPYLRAEAAHCLQYGPLRMALLHPHQFPNGWHSGHLYADPPPAGLPRSAVARRDERLVVHANWVDTFNAKIDLLRRDGLWWDG
jgi:hypothetical protein